MLIIADRRVVPYKSFNDWRAFTAELLGKAVEFKDEKSVDQARVLVGAAVAEVMDVIRPWHKGGTDEAFHADENKLRGIFINAVQLSKVLRRQRALWSIRLPWASGNDTAASSLRFNPTSMEDERGNEEVSVEELKTRRIEFIVTPALYKRGTMSGERFDLEEARCRAAVVIEGLN